MDNHDSSTRNLATLDIGEHVLIYNTNHHSTGRWDREGTIVQVLPYRQYKIKIKGSGRIVLRNRKFIKPVNATGQPSIIPSPSITSPEESTNAMNSTDNNILRPPLPDTEHPELPDTDQPAVVYQDQPLSRLPRALQRLRSHNKPGLTE